MHLLLLLACKVTGPGYIDDFSQAFCDYQARCAEPILLYGCDEPRTFTVDQCVDQLHTNHDLLEGCTWNAEHALDCIEAYEALQVCPSDGAGQPEPCQQVYSGGEACALFPYSLCEGGADTGDTAQDSAR